MTDDILCPNKFGAQKGVFQKCSLDTENRQKKLHVLAKLILMSHGHKLLRRRASNNGTQERIRFGLILFHRTLEFV